MLAYDVLARRDVHTERLDAAAVVDGHVTVLPRDLRKMLLHKLARTPSHFRHLLLPHLKLTLYEIFRHPSSFCWLHLPYAVSTRGGSVSVCKTTQYRSVFSRSARSCSSVAFGARMSKWRRID